ncbi:MAG: CHAT domain-containing protein [Cyclobacteriaceae bacterium]
MTKNLLVTFCLCCAFLVSAQESETLINRAHNLYDGLNYQEAAQVYQEILEENTNADARRGLIRSVFELGNQQQFNGKATSAQQLYGQALKQAIVLTETEKSAENLLLLGLMYLYNGDGQSAKTYYELALKTEPNNGRAYHYLWTLDPSDGLAKLNHPFVKQAFRYDPGLFELHQQLGSYYGNLGMADEAISSYKKAIELSPKNYKANFALGQVYWTIGDMDNAQYHFEQALKYFPGFGYAKMALAGIMLHKGDITSAIPNIRAALKDNPQTQQYLASYEQHYRELSNYNFVEQANESPIDAQGYPQYYLDAIDAAQAFEFHEAIDLFHQCKDAYDQYEAAEVGWQNSILSWLSHCYRSLGDYSKAVHTLKQALNLSFDHNLITDQASMAANLSMIYYAWGDLPNTIEYANQSVEILIKNGQNQHLYDAYINLGGYYREFGYPDSAVQYHQLALDKANSKVQTLLAQKELGLSFIANDDLLAAGQLLKVLIADRLNAGEQLTAIDYGIGKIYSAIGESKKAMEFLEGCTEHYIGLQEAAPAHPDLIPFVADYINVSIQQNEIDLAYYNYQALNFTLTEQIANYFQAMNENGKLVFYRKAKQYFEAFNAFGVSKTIMNQEVLGQMYQNQLLLKGLLFNESARIHQLLSNNEDAQVKQTYNALKAKRNLLARSIGLEPNEKQIDEEIIKNEIDSLESKLSGLGVTNINSAQEGLTDVIQKSLGDNEAAIEIIRYRDYDYSGLGKFTNQVHYLALIMKSGDQPIEYVLLNDGNKMEEKGYNAYTNGIEFDVADHQSYNLYWQPIQNKLKGISRVFVAGDGIYHKINLNTLFDPNEEQFLVEKLDLRIITSTKDLLKKSGDIPKKGTIMLIGSPNFSSGKPTTASYSALRAITSLDNLSPLPGTLSEVQRIDDLFRKRKWETVVLTGDKAQEEALKQVESPEILHIATHGYFEAPDNRENPLFYSGLLLTGASDRDVTSKEDGILTAYEAMNLDLRSTEMVVLSACETGMGKVENGEGIYGLQRAFMIAGAGSVIMSKWKVNDQTTMELMSAFYDKINDGQSKHKAFKAAQLEIKAKYTSPKHWGAFGIVGR